MVSDEVSGLKSVPSTRQLLSSHKSPAAPALQQGGTGGVQEEWERCEDARFTYPSSVIRYISDRNVR